MFQHGSRSFSPAVHGQFLRRPPRITIMVIHLAAKTVCLSAIERQKALKSTPIDSIQLSNGTLLAYYNGFISG